MASPRFCFVLLLPVGLLAGCQRQQSAPAAPPPPAVAVATLQSERVALTRELPGRSTAYLVAEVRPQVTGIVQRRLFAEGASVEAGQPLYQLDDSTYRADFNRAQATVARAESSLTLAQLNARRSEELSGVAAISRQEHENAVAALAQAEADLRVARAALASVEVVLGYTTIRAPISGRIGRSSVTQGALVTANQAAALATIQQLDPIYVDLTQSSRELLALRKDIAAGTLRRPEEAPVAIILEDGSRYPQNGRLEFAEVSVDPTTGSFAVRVVVANPNHILLPGMYVRAIITTGVREAGLLVPQPAVVRDATGETSVMIVGTDGIVQARAIQVSRTIGDQWLVESGLAAGDRVVVEGLQKIRPGIPVQITAADAAPVNPPAGTATAETAAPAVPVAPNRDAAKK